MINGKNYNYKLAIVNIYMLDYQRVVSVECWFLSIGSQRSNGGFGGIHCPPTIPYEMEPFGATSSFPTIYIIVVYIYPPGIKNGNEKWTVYQ